MVRGGVRCFAIGRLRRAASGYRCVGGYNFLPGQLVAESVKMLVWGVEVVLEERHHLVTLTP